jgi:hypothetical protein
VEGQRWLESTAGVGRLGVEGAASNVVLPGFWTVTVASGIGWVCLNDALRSAAIRSEVSTRATARDRVLGLE